LSGARDRPRAHQRQVSWRQVSPQRIGRCGAVRRESRPGVRSCICGHDWRGSMKKSLISSLVVLTTATLSSSAMAIIPGEEYTVEIDYAFGVSDINTLVCDPSFLVEDDEVLGHPAQFCQRVCKATFEADVLDSTTVWLWEKMTT